MDYDLRPFLTHKERKVTGEHHDYVLIASVENVGQQRVIDFDIRVFFPKIFLSQLPNSHWAFDASRSTKSHVCFVGDQRRAPNGLYRGERINSALEIEYFVDDRLYHDASAMGSQVMVELVSGSMERRTETYSMDDFHNF